MSSNIEMEELFKAVLDAYYECDGVFTAEIVAKHLWKAGYRAQTTQMPVEKATKPDADETEQDSVQRRHAKAQLPADGLELSKRFTEESLRREKTKYDTEPDADETERLSEIILAWSVGSLEIGSDIRDLAKFILSRYASRQSERELLLETQRDANADQMKADAIKFNRIIDAQSEREQRLDGVGLIAEERDRQVSEEGWNKSHDDEHTESELSRAGIAYAVLASKQAIGPSSTQMPHWWPWAATWWKASEDPIRNLTKAGALIAAEIDRLQRAALSEPAAKEQTNG